MGENGEGNQMLLFALVLLSLFAYASSGVALAFMFENFPCTDSQVIMSLTVVLCALATVYQLLFTSRGSLLTSAIVTSYATYLCFSSISLSPDLVCNPTINTSAQNWLTWQALYSKDDSFLT